VSEECFTDLLFVVANVLQLQVAWKWVKTTTESSQPGTPTSGGSSDSTTAHVSP
jgi:hypothetical protein